MIGKRKKKLFLAFRLSAPKCCYLQYEIEFYCIYRLASMSIYRGPDNT